MITIPQTLAGSLTNFSVPVRKVSSKPSGLWRAQRLPRAALLCVAVAVSACSKSGEQQAGPGGPGGAPMAMPVSVVALQVQKIPMTIEAVGQTSGAKEVEVRPRVSGILLKRLYQEGEVVKAGAPLFQIDRAPYDIALMQAHAALAQAAAGGDQARREAARLKPLVDERAISQKEYDDATSTQSSSSASVMAAQAQVKSAELNVAYTNVTAPITGVTGRAQHSEGSLVAAGSDLLTTVSVTDPIWVNFSFNETENLRLRQAADTRVGAGAADKHEVKLLLADGNMYGTTGKLNFAASTVDSKTGTVQMRAEFANPRLALLPGQFVRVQIVTAERAAFLVPQSALFQTDQGKVVYVASPDNKAVPHPVETDGWSGSNWVVTKGLSAGDKLILDNQMKLRPGAPVAPHPPGQMPGMPSAGGPAGAPAGAAKS